MGTRLLARCVVFALPAVGLSIACTGEDPVLIVSDIEDASSNVDAQESRDARDDGSAETDAGNDATVDADAGPAEVRICSLSLRDAGADASMAGPPTLRWLSQPPEGSGTPVLLKTLTYGDCVVNIGTIPVTPPGQPTVASVYMEKTNRVGATCTEPKGFRVIGNSYGDPAVVVAVHPFDQRLFVVASSSRNLSGSSPNVLGVAQYDFLTGDTLHVASLVAPGGMGGPGNFPNFATSLTVQGCNVFLQGTGPFPGATGTNNGSFSATYMGFLAAEPQPPSQADSANYKPN